MGPPFTCHAACSARAVCVVLADRKRLDESKQMRLEFGREVRRQRKRERERERERERISRH